MSKLKIYQAVLLPQTEKDLLNKTNGIPIEERIGECPDCKGTRWWLLPQASVAVKEGGKPYCECLGCGLQTHL